MDLTIEGRLSVCSPRFFTSESGEAVQWFQSGLVIDTGFAVLTSVDIRKHEGKRVRCKVSATPSKIQGSFKLKIIEADVIE